MIMHTYQATKDSIHHISVGAVLVNEQQQIASHHFDNVVDNQTGVVYSDFNILMRESLELNESLEQAVARGLMEEFGATGEITRYLGPLGAEIPHNDFTVMKTTLYFLVDLIHFDPNLRDDNDSERDSTIEWHDVDYLIRKMNQQIKNNPRPDLNEAEILERAKLFIS